MTDGRLPALLAQELWRTAADELDAMSMKISALEKCENMALKLKAAKFLRDSGKVNIDELRNYCRDLITGKEE